VLPFDIFMIGGEEAVSILPDKAAKEMFQEGIVRILKRSTITNSASQCQRNMFLIPHDNADLTVLPVDTHQCPGHPSARPFASSDSPVISFNCTSDQSNTNTVVSSSTAISTNSPDFPCNTLRPSQSCNA